MSHVAYELGLIRRDQLIREAADGRLAAPSARSAHRAASATANRRPRRLTRPQWVVGASRIPLRLMARGH